MATVLFETDSCSAKTKVKTLNIGVVGPFEAGKSEFIKYLIKDNEFKGFEITGNCYVRGLRVFYKQSETVILNVTEYRGSMDEQLKEAGRWKLDVYFLFYDVSNLTSFKDVKNKWLVTLYDRVQPTFVMGNKVDVPKEKKAPTKMPDISQEAWKTGHVEISSITGTNVNPFIKRAIEIMLGVDVEIQGDLDLAQSMGNMQLSLLNQPKEDDQYYDMTGNRKGICLIISIRSFVNQAIQERKGAERDEQRLSKLFKALGFDVRLHTDQKALPIQNMLAEVAELNHTNSKCFILIVMSHGKEGCVLGADNAPIPIENLILPFISPECKSLEGKPKLFFIQACQGEQFMQSTSSFQTDSPGASARISAATLPSFSCARGYSTIPATADCLIANSTVNGYVSYRTPEEGSVFIAVLVEEIEKTPEASFVDILTRVNSIIADMEFGGNKQMTCFRSTLRKHVVLKTT